ncbi:MAG TPA: STAS domain-containing protein [Gemmataceae bacterium]|nr:STAS domain-containing protein [Gemmataceae bacterium]
MSPSRPASIGVDVDSSPGVIVAKLEPTDRRLVAGLDSGPEARATLLGDDILRAADSSRNPLVLDMLGVDWIDSGACAVLIKVSQSLRVRGQPLVISLTNPVHETFRITGLVRLIPCFTDLASAVAAAQSARPSGPAT